MGERKHLWGFSCVLDALRGFVKSGISVRRALQRVSQGSSQISVAATIHDGAFL